MKQYLNGKEIIGLPTNGAIFYSKKNPEFAKAVADFQNFVESMATQFADIDTNPSNATKSIILKHLHNGARFNQADVGYLRNDEIDTGKINFVKPDSRVELIDDVTKHFKLQDLQSHYSQYFGININSQVQWDKNTLSLSELQDYDKQMILYHTQVMAEKVGQGIKKHRGSAFENLEQVPYNFDFKRSIEIYGDTGNLGGDNQENKIFSKIDSSYYIPKEYSIEPVLEKTMTAKIITLLDGLELEPLLQASSNLSQSEIGAQNKLIAQRNNAKIKGKFVEIQQSIFDGTHEKGLQETSMSEIEQEQPKQKTQVKSDQPKEEKKSTDTSEPKQKNKLTSKQLISINERFDEAVFDANLGIDLSNADIKTVKDLLYKKMIEKLESGIPEEQVFSELPKVLETRKQAMILAAKREQSGS